MCKLIRSDLSRLFRLKSFWVLFVITIIEDINTVADPCINYPGADYSEVFPYLCLGLIIEAAVILGNLIGSDYTHGTVRNKTIAGHSRSEIFFSNWITSLICMLILTVESYAVSFITGSIAGGTFSWSADRFALFIGLTLLCVLVIVSFFTFLYMTIFSQSASLTAALIISGFVIITTFSAITGLYMQYIGESTAQALIAEGVEVQRAPDGSDMYLDPYASQEGLVSAHITNILSPISHILMMNDMDMTGNVIAMSAEIILFTAAGLIIFRRRDLK